ncbi:MinD/ParA family protein [Aeromicrobium phragmitis]|uniref:MinD/ParA family protein n=1 Tax=Aeromicrobium phragmitis TaxID=2478914 RepID=A0A3L8PMP2_9ACTN|nr:P-loop NTPase [Aeromicrobium phragmitis]RLV56676.1 MinD/ParA family protein [Aeromicrobium phragmitis]
MINQYALLVGADDETAARIGRTIGHRCVGLEADGLIPPHTSLLRGLNPHMLPEVIVFAATLPRERSLALATEVHTARPDIQLMLVAPTEKEIIVDAMRVGIREVAPSLDDAAFLAAIRDRLAARREDEEPFLGVSHPAPPEDRGSQIIAVVSPKGGVGKTSIAASLALTLARRAPMDVVLVDLDLQFGDIATVLDLAPHHTVEHVFATDQLDNLLLKTHLTLHPASHTFVLCGADSPAATDQVTGEQVARLLRQLASQFTYVVVDTAAGVDEATLSVLETADEAVVVSTLDLPCLRSVRKELELLADLNLLPPVRHTVVNLADKTTGLKIKDVEGLVQAPVDVVIARTKDVPAATNRGVPLVLTRKRGPFVKGIELLAERVARGTGPEGDKGSHRRLEVA